MVAYYHNLFTKEEELKKICKECKSGSRGCVDCKRQLIKNICDILKPIRDKRKFYENNIDIVDKILIEAQKKHRKKQKK